MLNERINLSTYLKKSNNKEEENVISKGVATYDVIDCNRITDMILISED